MHDDDLRAYARRPSIQPDWPTDAERREDLAHHIALKQAIDSAASAFAAARR